MKTSFAIVATAALLASFAKTSLAVNDVGGTLVTLTNTATTPNGAWSWFEDERAIIDDSDPDNTLLLVSSVSGGSGAERGDVDLLWLNIDTGVQGEFELHDRLEQDDHNSAALWIRPDGRYVAAYGRHGSDNFMRWRISSNPGDPRSWSSSQSLDVSPNSNAGATYNNLHYLPADNGGAGRLYNFTRTENFDPNVVTSDNHGDTWSYGGKLLTEGGGGTRPYVRYFSDGDKVHFIATNNHPRNANNSIYHGYVKDGQLFNSGGGVVDANLFDGVGMRPSDLTTVFAANTIVDGNPMTRAWTVDVAIDEGGNPVAVFQARIDPGGLSGGGESLDHQFFYATYDDIGGTWNVNSLAAAGRDIYAASPNGSEDDYTGLISIDPNDTSTLYMSTDIDPRTNVEMPHYEILRGKTHDNGASWQWDAITFNSTVNNVRPLVPNWNSEETALVWMRGQYNTYTSFATEVVVLTDVEPVEESLFGDFNSDEAIDISDYAILLRNLNQDLTHLTPAQASALGDLTGDQLTSFDDLVVFRSVYDAANGAGSLAEIASNVPEPTTVWLLCLSGVALAATRFCECAIKATQAKCSIAT